MMLPFYCVPQQQCDQIGRFFKLQGDKKSTKVAQVIGNFLGYFEKSHSCVSTAASSFWVTFGKIWALFYSNTVTLPSHYVFWFKFRIGRKWIEYKIVNAQPQKCKGQNVREKATIVRGQNACARPERTSESEKRMCKGQNEREKAKPYV